MAMETSLWILKISGVESSSHTLESDAELQKQRYIDDGVSEGDITITAPST